MFYCAATMRIGENHVETRKYVENFNIGLEVRGISEIWNESTHKRVTYVSRSREVKMEEWNKLCAK